MRARVRWLLRPATKTPAMSVATAAAPDGNGQYSDLQAVNQLSQLVDTCLALATSPAHCVDNAANRADNQEYDTGGHRRHKVDESGYTTASITCILFQHVENNVRHLNQSRKAKKAYFHIELDENLTTTRRPVTLTSLPEKAAAQIIHPLWYVFQSAGSHNGSFSIRRGGQSQPRRMHEATPLPRLLRYRRHKQRRSSSAHLGTSPCTHCRSQSAKAEKKRQSK